MSISTGLPTAASAPATPREGEAIGFQQRAGCPICGCRDTEVVYSARFTEPPISTYLHEFYSRQGKVEFEYLENEDFILDECQECSLIFQRSIPNDAFMMKLYEEWIDPQLSYMQRLQQKDTRYYAYLANSIRTVHEYLGKRPAEMEFLDFGMGWGSWCQMAKAFGSAVAGAEVSPARIDHALAQGIKVISWHDIAECKFDLIHAEQVFEHLADPLETLNHLAGALKPSGIIELVVPNAANARQKLAIGDWLAARNSRDSLVPVAPLEHINCFTERSLRHMVWRARLERVDILRYRRLSRYTTIADLLKPAYRFVVEKLHLAQRGSLRLYLRRSDNGSLA